MNIGDKLIALRKQNNMTQEEVADRLGVTRQTISNWELNQTKPDSDQLIGVSGFYGISLDELVDNKVKEVLTAKVSNVERLAGLTYRILKFVAIGFVVISFLLIILSILFMI